MRVELSRREIGTLLAGASLLAVAMHWPLPLELDNKVPKDLGDSMGETWQLAWIGHALLHQPGHLFQANIWWPLENSLATTDILFGYAPVTLIGTGPEAALVHYNLLFLFAYALAFAGAYLLARELGVGWAGAAVAGAAFAYAPWRLAHDSHLNLLSSGGIPLSIFLLLRGYRRSSPGMVLAGWLVVAWQLLLGIGLGIQLVYLLLALGVIAAVYCYRQRPPVRRGLLIATAAGVGVLLLSGAWLARPYLELRKHHPEATRTLENVEQFSPDAGAFFRAPPGNLIWGSPPPGDSVVETEFSLFPGAAIVSLAIVGFFASVYPKRRRVGLALAIVGLAVLSFGYSADRGVPVQPYKLVYEYLPGWDSVRAPTRINTLTSLGLALLAAAGAQTLVGWSARWSSRRKRPGAIPNALAVALVVTVVLEGSGFQLRDGGLRAPELAHVRLAPVGQLGAPEPQLHLPIFSGPSGSTITYAFWSIDGFPEMANGWGGFIPAPDLLLNIETAAFPDAKSVAFLRRYGIRTVILHPDLVPGTAAQYAAERPVKGLPLRREVRGDVILYHLEPDN